MKLKLELASSQMNDYLQETEEVDFSHPHIRKKAEELQKLAIDELSYIENAFHFVRDEIAHSWDIQSPRVTWKASDVLYFKEGICYAKSNLLCALLRCKGIPAGFCYQRLTLGDTPDTGYAIHALNAVYLRCLDRWIRLDARGNKEGVCAQFSIDKEKLAFPVRTKYDEADYPIIYAQPNQKTMEVLKQSENALDMYRNRLPDQL